MARSAQLASTRPRIATPGIGEPIFRLGSNAAWLFGPNLDDLRRLRRYCDFAFLLFSRLGDRDRMLSDAQWQSYRRVPTDLAVDHKGNVRRLRDEPYFFQVLFRVLCRF